MFWRMYKVRLVLGVIGIFFVSMVMSCQELRYMISGKTVEAAMDGTHIEKTGSDNGGMRRVLAYSFPDKDDYRREYTTVPLDWPGESSRTVKVQFIPGRPTQSRLYGQTNLMWVCIFFGSLAASAVGIVILAREK